MVDKLVLCMTAVVCCLMLRANFIKSADDLLREQSVHINQQVSYVKSINEEGLATVSCKVKSFKTIGTDCIGMIVYDYGSKSNMMFLISKEDYIVLVEDDDIEVLFNVKDNKLQDWDYANV